MAVFQRLFRQPILGVSSAGSIPSSICYNQVCLMFIFAPTVWSCEASFIIGDTIVASYTDPVARIIYYPRQLQLRLVVSSLHNSVVFFIWYSDSA